jgi:hypothetical protein
LCPFGHCLRQVFGLTGYLPAPASQSIIGPVLRLELSFLITAAGQFRVLTGFPFSLLLEADTGNILSIDQINLPNNEMNPHRLRDFKALSRSLLCLLWRGGPGRSPDAKRDSDICGVVARAGVQPATFALGVRCSMQLSYRATFW